MMKVITNGALLHTSNLPPLLFLPPLKKNTFEKKKCLFGPQIVSKSMESTFPLMGEGI